MKRILTALVVVCIGSGAFMPVYADDCETTLTSAVKLPMRVTALAAGLTFGIPISTIQQVPTRIVSLASDTSENNIVSDLALIVPVALIGGAVGIADGVKYGVVNALENFYDKPFGPESFSLVEQQGD